MQFVDNGLSFPKNNQKLMMHIRRLLCVWVAAVGYRLFEVDAFLDKNISWRITRHGCEEWQAYTKISRWKASFEP